jgi:hypothetical protein
MRPDVIEVCPRLHDSCPLALHTERLLGHLLRPERGPACGAVPLPDIYVRAVPLCARVGLAASSLHEAWAAWLRAVA